MDNMSELPLHDSCENLMNVVVETRKSFGKLCMKYGLKTSSMENRIFNLHLETLAKARFKPKYENLDLTVGHMKKESNDFATEIQEVQNRIENLSTNLKNIEKIVLQIKEDKLGRKINRPFTTESILKLN